jgi:cytoskeleton protein RodZ
MSEPAAGSAGALLRAAREKQGLHIAALAAAIKVSPRKLEALESDRLSELPDATFTRALAQTVCRTLKIDARPVLDLLPPAPSVALEPHSGSLNAPFRDRPGREGPRLSSLALRPVVGVAALLVAGACAVYFMPAGLWAPRAEPVAAPVAVAVPASAPLAAEAAASVASAPAVLAAASELAASAAEPMGETVFSAPPAELATTGAAAPPSGLVQLRSSEASWVEARDSRGQLLLSRTVLPGESVGLDGSLPIRLTIGNAAATQLGFRGQPVDLAARTRDNVARVELQ